TARANHRLDNDTGEPRCVPVNQRGGVIDVVVGCNDGIERNVQRIGLGCKGKKASVVATMETKYGRTIIEVAGQLNGEHVRFGAGIDEADALHGGKSSGQDLRKFVLERRMATEVPAEVEPLQHRFTDQRVAMAIDGSGLLTNEVAVLVSVHIPELRALASLEHDRIRLVEDPGPRIAAGQRLQRRLIYLAAFRIVAHVV